MTGTEYPTVTLTRHEHVTAVLNDPRYVVPPLPELGDVVRARNLVASGTMSL